MSIKWKLLMMVGLPISAMVIIFAVGLTSFYTIETNMSEVNTVHLDRATMIDADRDAYQAQVAVMEAITSTSADTLGKSKAASDSNLQQTWERIIGPAKNFTPDMGTALDSFKVGYSKWKGNNETIFALTSETLGTNIQRDQAVEGALASFDAMRNEIDKLGEIIGNRLKDSSLSQQARLQAEEALSKVLNADRDADRKSVV